MTYTWKFERKSTLHMHVATNGRESVAVTHNHLIQDVPPDAEGYVPHVSLKITRPKWGGTQEFVLRRNGHPDDKKGEFTARVKTSNLLTDIFLLGRPWVSKLSKSDVQYVKDTFDMAIAVLPSKKEHSELRLFKPAMQLVKQRILARL